MIQRPESTAAGGSLAALCAALVLVAFALVTSGCLRVGPDYAPVEQPVPDAWHTAAARDVAAAASPLETWWTSLGDPHLEALIEQASDANLDLRIAAERIREARAQRGVVGGERLPSASVDAAYTRGEQGENGLVPPANDGDAFDLYEAGIGFNWEIDVFGRIARAVEAADAQLEASIEDYRDVMVLLYASVASTYVDVRTAQQRLAYARSNIDAQRETVQLTRDRFDAGLTSALDVAQAESNLANSEAQIPLLEQAVEVGLNRIAILVGEPPGAVHEAIGPWRPIPRPDVSVAAGLPADLLRRRPDVRRAERRVAAQTARIGVAKAELYPSFSLAGALTLQSTDAGDLAEGDSLGWSFVPGLRWNLFSGGRIRSQVRVEESRTEQALLAYEQTVLLALEEVENAMVALQRERVRRDRLEDAVAATTRSVELVRTQYLSGLTNFQNYLDAQRSLFNQQDQLAESEGRVVQALIRLNRSLGGGWAVEAEEGA